MFLSTPDVPETRPLKITMPTSAWKQLDELAKVYGTQNVVEHTISTYLMAALKKEKRQTSKGMKSGGA